MNGLEINYKEIDGAIFLSDAKPDICLKRWWDSHIEMMAQTIDFFEFCNNLIEEHNLESIVKIPIVYEQGLDWVMMDYDASAIALDQLKENEVQKNILNMLYEACSKVHVKNSVYLMKMIENKSLFIRESFVTKQLTITGLQIY